MKCKFCGAENRESADRCYSCGSPLQQDGAPYQPPYEDPQAYDQQQGYYDQGYQQQGPPYGQPYDPYYGQQQGYQPPYQQPPYQQPPYQPPYQQQPPYQPPYPQQPYYPQPISACNRWVALILCIFLGGIGIHRFYVGKIGTGILYIFTGGLCGIGWLVDIIMIACGSFTDSSGLQLKD